MTSDSFKADNYWLDEETPAHEQLKKIFVTEGGEMDEDAEDGRCCYYQAGKDLKTVLPLCSSVFVTFNK